MGECFLKLLVTYLQRIFIEIKELILRIINLKQNIMHKYFLVKIKYEKTAEEGKIVKVSESYLVNALSFSEAEAIIIKEMRPFISGEFTVANITPTKVNELFENENGDKWFKCKVNFVTLDEQKGVEKLTPTYMYVQSNALKEARENLVEGMKGSMADYVIASVTETKIIDVIKYEVE